MRFPNSIVSIAALIIAAPAAAGVIFRTEQTTDAGKDRAGNDRHTRTVMEVSAEGDAMRADVTESDQQAMPVGSYILFASDGMMHLVNPANKTYMTMDPEIMAGMAQTAHQTMKQQGVSMTPENVVVEKKVDETGPVMLSLPTQHVVYEVSYSQPSPAAAAGIKPAEVHETCEIWATHGLDTRLAAVAGLKKGVLGIPSGGGGSDPKELSEAIAGHGVIVKKLVTRETKPGGMSGVAGFAMFVHVAAQKQSTSFAITAIRDETVARERFVLPEGYREVEPMNPNMGAMPDVNSLPGKGGSAAPPPGAPQPGGPVPPGTAPPKMPDLNNIPAK